MDIKISLPDEIQGYVEEQVQAGRYRTPDEYLVDLVQQDRQRRSQEKLEALLLEGLNSGSSQEVTPEFWQHLRESVLGSASAEVPESPEA